MGMASEAARAARQEGFTSVADGDALVLRDGLPGRTLGIDVASVLDDPSTGGIVASFSGPYGTAREAELSGHEVPGCGCGNDGRCSGDCGDLSYPAGDEGVAAFLKDLREHRDYLAGHGVR